MKGRGATIVVTGGTGSFGRRFVERALATGPKRVVVFSRDEHKQHAMRRELPDRRLAFVVGDVRDLRAVREALHGATIVVHAAALKHVPVGEAHPLEAIQTNVLGAANVAEAAIAARVPRVLALSSDKAVHPVNVYGATKMLSERIFLQAGDRRDNRGSRFSCVRYGNVLGSRGSVVHEIARQRRAGRIDVTDPRTTRFWMTLDEATAFVLKCLGVMKGGEIFVPRVRGARLVDLVRAVAPRTPLRVTGRRAGDKIHELLVSEDEAPFTTLRDGMFVVRPWVAPPRGSGFAGLRYASHEVPPLSPSDLARLVRTR